MNTGASSNFDRYSFNLRQTTGISESSVGRKPFKVVSCGGIVVVMGGVVLVVEVVKLLRCLWWW